MHEEHVKNYRSQDDGYDEYNTRFELFFFNNFKSKKKGKSRNRVETYEIIIRYVLQRVDIVLMVFLYSAGNNRIDIYHMSLLIVFASYIIYPVFIRKYYIVLLYYIVIFTSLK
jgi:hypothetical protein